MDEKQKRKKIIMMACGGILITLLFWVSARLILYGKNLEMNYAVKVGTMIEAEPYINALAYKTAERQDVTVAANESGEEEEEPAVQEVVVDTEPPVIEGVKDLISRVDDRVDYYEGVFVWDDYDEDITLTIDSSQVDIHTIGDYPVIYSAVDRAGNQTKIEASVKIALDAEPPVITGAADISLLLYETYDYAAGVSVQDNSDTDLTLQIDDSQVNPDEAGTYPLTYSAVDHTGNQASVTIEVNITEDPDYSEFYTAIAKLKEDYPDGAYWNYGGVTDTACSHSTKGEGTCNTYVGVTNDVYPFYVTGAQCLGFASMLSDAVFGKDAQVYLYEGFENIRPGDQIRLVAWDHSLFVIGKAEDYVVVAECNADYQTCKIAWGRKITRAELEGTSVLYISRY